MATISATGSPWGSDFTIASTVVNSRMPPAAAVNGTAGRAWSVVEAGCIGGELGRIVCVVNRWEPSRANRFDDIVGGTIVI
jgi:hypothetical protein